MSQPHKQERIREAVRAGDALFDGSKYGPAAEHYREAVRLHGGAACEDDLCFHAHVRRGASLVNIKPRRDVVPCEAKLQTRGALAEAERLFERALNFRGGAVAGYKRDEAEAYRYWGDALLRLRRWDEAAAKYAEATRLRVAYPEAIKGWGNALFYMGNHDAAIEKYVEALKYRPDYSSAIFNWGYVLQDKGDGAGAVEKYEQVTRLGAKDPRSVEDAASAYNNWGRILSESGDDEGALEKFREATRLGAASDNYHFFCNNLGGSLSNFRRYAEAIEQFKQAQSHSPNYYYPYHNEAFVYWQTGRYRDARRTAARALKCYRVSEEDYRDGKNARLFRFYAELLHKVFGPSEKGEDAKAAYREALKFNPKDADAAVGLVTLCAEMREGMTNYDKKAAAYWEADELTRSTRKRLEESLKKREEEAALHGPGAGGNRPGRGGPASELYALGRLLLAAKEYDAAEVYLLKAVEADPTRVKYYADLGVLCARKEDYQRAVGYFERALERDPGNLSVRSNLAEAHRQLGKVDKAEQEYRRILDVTACHVESYVGLGEVCVEMAAAGGADMYEEAIRNFDEGLRLLGLDCASKRLMDRERAAVFYARGYARVGLYESAKVGQDDDHLRKASEDFAAAYVGDRSMHKAKRAHERVESRLHPPAGQHFAKTYGPVIIFLAALAGFMFAQLSFFATGRLDATNYTVASFGSLMFMLASLSIPQLLKFKVAGVELEKSSIEQVSLTEHFNLSKPE